MSKGTGVLDRELPEVEVSMLEDVLDFLCPEPAYED